MSLAEKKCVPCEGGIPPLNSDEIQKHLKQLDGWILSDSAIQKAFKFDSYKQGLDFVYSVGNLAEEQGHHPDVFLGYKKADIRLKTHAIDGLSENDFIVAAKIDKIKQSN